MKGVGKIFNIIYKINLSPNFCLVTLFFKKDRQFLVMTQDDVNWNKAVICEKEKQLLQLHQNVISNCSRMSTN